MLREDRINFKQRKKMKKILVILTFLTSMLFGISGAIDLDKHEINSTVDNNDTQEVSLELDIKDNKIKGNR